MSAKNSTTLWNLRCSIREDMIAFIQKQFPQYLPRYRAEVEEPQEPTGQANVLP